MAQYNDEFVDRESRKTAPRERVRRHAEPVERGPVDIPFLLLTLIILAIGVIMVLSASFARAYYESGDPIKYFSKQLLFAVSGVALMLIASRFSVRLYRATSMYVLLFSLLLLALVPIIGVADSSGTKRWLYLGFTTFQPSELTKLAVILFFANMICVFGDKMKTFKYGILPFVGILGVIVVLLYMQPHLSAAIIIIAIGAIMLFAGGIGWHWIAGVLTAVVGGAYIVITKTTYAANRIAAWQDPFSDPTGKGWQTIQSLYSVGSGGLLGLGLGQSRQKYLYLPEEYNDFIFSIACEELGFVGAMLILCLFALLIIRGYWLAVHARDRFGALVITGITSHVAIQVFLNIAVVTNLVPCTGISLPFFSYGGTALWMQLIEMGIVLSISRDIPLRRLEKKKGAEEK